MAHNGLQISEGTNSVGFSEGFGLLLMCCYALVAVYLAVNFIRSNVFCSFFRVGIKLLITFYDLSCVYDIHYVYLPYN